ncbi:type II secretion system protein [Candidatus Kaiserbacteria bacterium]|nr:type II secretion system protein [Candidatus Kaiserbacteria bacterium]
MTAPFHTSKRAAFTLVETLIAVTILTLAVAGPLFTASRAIIAAQIARDQLIASYLAQEGLEYARAMRDNAYLAVHDQPNASSLAWNNFLINESQSGIFQCRAPKICTLDSVQGGASPLTSCPGNSCTDPLYLLSNGIYSQQNLPGSTKTPFVRSIQAIDVSATDERIVATVTWSFHGITYAVTSTDHFTSWQ